MLQSIKSTLPKCRIVCTHSQDHGIDDNAEQTKIEGEIVISDISIVRKTLTFVIRYYFRAKRSCSMASNTIRKTCSNSLFSNLRCWLIASLCLILILRYTSVQILGFVRFSFRRY